jgi:dihydroxyacid dehydratase/phosphogluconate dehydratase
MSRLKPFLDLSQVNVSGSTLGDVLDSTEVYNDDVIRPLNNPIYAEGALAVLRGNLAPNGCVMKPSAAAPHLLRHSGPALVFDSYPDLKANIDRNDLDVTASMCWCCAMPDHSAARACRSGVCCQSRRSFSSKACATWYVYPMRV